MDEPPATTASPLHPDPAPAALSSEERHLLAYLRDRDAACPLCGYNLRALTLPRCPECGKALKLTVGLVEPFLKAWIACAAATCLSAGTGVFIIIVIQMGGGTPGFPSWLVAIGFFSFPAMIPVAVVVLLCRRPFLKRSRQTQIILAIVAVGAVAAQFSSIPLWLG